jgi:hypothetical protein
MMRTVIFVTSFVWLFVLCANSWAQRLQWDAEEQKFTPSPSDTAVVAHFKFKNVGDAEADITAVNSSCSCTKITLDKRKYAPGESGDLVATFTIGVRTGVQDKVILVESNDVAKPRAVLRMKVTIPELAQLRPSFLFWNAGEPASPKSVSFKIRDGVPVTSVAVESSNLAISAKVETVVAGREYRIIVMPTSTNEPLTATMTIKMDYPRDDPKKFIVTARVLPAK